MDVPLPKSAPLKHTCIIRKPISSFHATHPTTSLKNESYARETSPVTLINSRRLMDLSSSSSLSDAIGNTQGSSVELKGPTLNAAKPDTSDAAGVKFARPSGQPPVGVAPTPRSPVSHKRVLRHQSSLNDENSQISSTSQVKSFQKSSSVQPQSRSFKGENDGTGEECLPEKASPQPATASVSANSAESSGHHPISLCHSNSGGGLHKPNHTISGSRESNLNATSTYSYANGACGQRPPAIRSNSSSSSLFASSSPPNSSSPPGKEDRKERRVSGSERYRPRRGAMVSCENLLAESSELFSSVPESTLKNLKNSSRKIYRSGGGIFSNPFKSDTEKMEQLSDLLKQYRDNGIPDSKHLSMMTGANKLNHLRASSLSISWLLGHNQASSPNSNPASGQMPSLLSTTKTSLSTTDLHHLNHSTSVISPLGLVTSTPSGPIISSSFDSSCDSNYYLEPEWRSIVDNADQMSAHVRSQNEAIWELLQTEVSYIRRLKVINDIFIACLLNLQNECLLTEIDAKSVFSNIVEVFEANHHFWMNHLLPMLNHSRETKSPLNPAMMEEGFLQFDKIFRPYIQYCLEHSACLQYVKEKSKSNILFKTYILWCENHKDCERLHLMDLLVKPMQRLTKYSLLLKAILKKTDKEAHKESLKRMDIYVENFVVGVNASMKRQQELERLSAVVSRIESYDVIDCNNDEAEKFLKDYLSLDLMQSMPGCNATKIRHLYLEDTLKLKDSQSNKQDVHCFLFTDVFLVCKSLNKKSSDSKMKVIRQPFITDRLIVHELKDASGFLMIYLNELNVASTFLLLFTPDTRIWVENIRKAQEDYRNLKYSSEQIYSTYHSNYDDDEVYESGAHGMLSGNSPRSSSRSSLIHSHSGSQDMSDQISISQPRDHTLQISGSSNQLAIQQQPPRAVSFELGELRNPSLVVEDADSFARSQSVDNRSPVVTVTSPRPERRAFLLRNNGKNNSNSALNNENSSPSGSIAYLNQNSLSVNVPCLPQQKLLPVQPRPRSGRRSGSNSPSNSQSALSMCGQPTPSVPHVNANYLTGLNTQSATIQVSVHPPPCSPPSPPPLPPTSPKRSLSHKVSRPLPPLPPQAATPPPLPTVPPPPPPPPPSLMSISSRSQPPSMTMTINKPPLVKTKNVSCGVASLSYATEKTPGHVLSICEPSCDIGIEGQNSSVNVCLDHAYQGHSGEGPSVNSDNVEEHVRNVRYNQQQKRTCRPDRRYHTADSIEHLKKEKDNSIHKRLSWNYGQQHLCAHQTSCTHCSHHCTSGQPCGSSSQLLQPRPLASSQHSNKCLSSDSVYSSSGFSSTNSVPLSVGSTENNFEQVCTCCGMTCVELPKCRFDEEEEESIQKSPSDRDSALPASPALNSSTAACYHTHTNSQCSIESSSSNCDEAHSTQPQPVPNSDIKIDVSEIKDGISSVQITLIGGPNNVARPSKADLKKMKEFLLSNCNMESSEV